MILCIVFAVLAPPICRAMMAATPANAQHCCGTGNDFAPRPSESLPESERKHQSCPLYRVDQTKLILSAKADVEPASAELVPLDVFLIQSHFAFAEQLELVRVALHRAPPHIVDQSRIYLLIRTLRI